MATGFAAKWFFVYYSVLGLLLILSGGYLAITRKTVQNWLVEAAGSEHPPVILVRIIKYLALFTLPGLVLAFFPFSWVELLFCIWSLIVLYIGAIQLVRWKQSRMLITQNQERLTKIIRSGGAIMLSVGFAILLLAYFVIQRF